MRARAPEMWAVEGLMMRLLALWETTGGSAAAASALRSFRLSRYERQLTLND